MDNLFLTELLQCLFVNQDPIVLNTIQPEIESKWDKRQTQH